MKTYFHRRATVSITGKTGKPGTDVDVSPGETSNSFVITVPQGDKGEKGDAFTYDDLTDEQKAALREGITLDAIGLTEITSDEIDSICT